MIGYRIIRNARDHDDWEQEVRSKGGWSSFDQPRDLLQETVHEISILGLPVLLVECEYSDEWGLHLEVMVEKLDRLKCLIN